MDSIHSIIAVSYYSQDSSEDDACVVWNRSIGIGPDMFVVSPRCGLQSESADASVCDNSTCVNKPFAADVGKVALRVFRCRLCHVHNVTTFALVSCCRTDRFSVVRMF